MYRFQKFARKHKPGLATAVAIAVCLLLGTTVSAWQARHCGRRSDANEAEAQANAKRQRASQRASRERTEGQHQRRAAQEKAQSPAR